MRASASFVSAAPAARTPRRGPRRACPRASLVPADDGVPVGTLIAAGVSVGIVGATFENMLQVLYKRRRPTLPSDDELCPACSGFGSVRCEVCGSRGTLVILGTSYKRVCPACDGRKRERCRRCAGTGKSGRKKPPAT